MLDRFVVGILFLILMSASFYSLSVEKPAVESFESSRILDYYDYGQNSQLTLSGKHYKFGQQTLEWKWQRKSHVTTKNFRLLTHEESPLKYGTHFPSSPTFVISLYSEKVQDTSLTFSFSKHGRQKVWFDFPLNFSGWRTVWVPFYEMKGKAPAKNTQVNYDTFSINSIDQGHVFIDDIVFSQYQDDRHPYPSIQTPFIQKQAQATASDHWMPLFSDLQRIQNISPTEIVPDDIKQLKDIESKISEMIVAQANSSDSIDELKKKFDSLGLVYSGEHVQGPPLTYALSQVYFNENQQGKKRHIPLKHFGQLLKKLALYYMKATENEKDDLKEMFIGAASYYLDQGWQAGSSMGTLHHIGYSTRELTEAFYLMREPLKKSGLLNDVGSSLQWIFNLGKVLGEKEDFHANIDYMNTQSFYHLLLIFLNDERKIQALLLDNYSHYISTILAQDDSQGVFKVDGTAWHHGGHYPAYALGAFEKIPQLIYILADSRFKISELGHANFKKAFLASRIYSQPFDFGFGNSGRHPFDGSFAGLQQQYLQLVLAGNPKHTTNIDEEVAAAYLRLWGKEDPKYDELFKQYDVTAERLSGYYSFPYAATAVHRRKNWAALIKGHSQYVWASEIYVASNRYGRYPANGTVQLLNGKGEQKSGFNQAGWDWNRFPAATVINLPIEQLETKHSLLMYRSNEKFVGSTELNGNGVFAMQLDQSQGFNHEPSTNEIKGPLLPGQLKAKKSVFSFDKKLILIGTDISSNDTENPVHTNLFQSHLTDKALPLYTSNIGEVTKFPFKATMSSNKAVSNNWLIDPYGNGYHLLSTNNISINKQHQNSYHNKYSKRTGKKNSKGKGVTKTNGDFASAWLDHGIAPTNASYQYTIYPFMTKAQIKSFNATVDSEPSYGIMQADNKVHIVHDFQSDTIGYALFSAVDEIKHGFLESSSSPALVMLQNNEDKSISLSAVQPDLNFPQLKPIVGYSRPVPLTLTVKGEWKVPEYANISAVNYVNGNTELKLICQHGLPTKFDLTEK